MYLLKFDASDELSLVEVQSDGIPPYATLSHTWEKEEVLTKDIANGTYKSKAGYTKIEFCGRQAQKDGLDHFWVDTCCIDKSSSAELSEAVNSMFKWYSNASKCYVYLSDVSAALSNNDGQLDQEWEASFQKSKWFTRGWTLQELLASKTIQFFSQDWKLLGDKNQLETLIHEITEIPLAALRRAPLAGFSIAERLQWAEGRKTTREEDRAYCLLGIFDVAMPLLYGEGEKKAHARLERGIQQRLSDTELISDRLPYAQGAIYNSDAQVHVACHPATRADALLQIRDWAQESDGPPVFWLTGPSGIGKSTISWTFADWLTKYSRNSKVDLGASFFFIRDADHRTPTSRFFTTIIQKLVSKIPGLERLVAEAINLDPFVYHKALAVQFNKLVYEPLHQLNSTQSDFSTLPTLVVVIDALEECRDENDMKLILDLCSGLSQIKAIRIKLFFASRLESPIQQMFAVLPAGSHRVMNLDEIPQATIKGDICAFFNSELADIRRDFNDHKVTGRLLEDDWPGDGILNRLVKISGPLFITAVTLCRYIDTPHLESQLRLAETVQLNELTCPCGHQYWDLFQERFVKDIRDRTFNNHGRALPMKDREIALREEMSPEAFEASIRAQSMIHWRTCSTRDRLNNEKPGADTDTDTDIDSASLSDVGALRKAIDELSTSPGQPARIQEAQRPTTSPVQPQARKHRIYPHSRQYARDIPVSGMDRQSPRSTSRSLEEALLSPKQASAITSRNLHTNTSRLSIAVLPSNTNNLMTTNLCPYLSNPSALTTRVHVELGSRTSTNTQRSTRVAHPASSSQSTEANPATRRDTPRRWESSEEIQSETRPNNRRSRNEPRRPTTREDESDEDDDHERHPTISALLTNFVSFGDT